jgi:hypothetical protein
MNSCSSSHAPVLAQHKCCGASHWDPLWERIGGTQTHSRRTGEKLGRLQRARQALVRQAESNTKCGGKRGKPWGRPIVGFRQVPVSPQGFSNQKPCDPKAIQTLPPLFTAEVFSIISTSELHSSANLLRHYRGAHHADTTRRLRACKTRPDLSRQAGQCVRCGRVEETADAQNICTNVMPCRPCATANAPDRARIV